MRRTSVSIYLSLFLAVVNAQEWTIKARKTVLREENGVWAQELAILHEGDNVTACMKDGQPIKEGKWLQVKFGGQEGWVQETAVTDQKLETTRRRFTDSGGTSYDEVALATKGFSPEIENSYRGQNPNLKDAYLLVDEMENDFHPPLRKNSEEERQKVRVLRESLEKFRKDGNLKSRGDLR